MSEPAPGGGPEEKVAYTTLRTVSWGITAFLVIFIFGTLFAIGRARQRAGEEQDFPQGLRKLVAGAEGEKDAKRAAAEEGFEDVLSGDAKLVSDLVAKGRDAEEVRKHLTLLQLGDSYVFDLNPEGALPYWQRVKTEFPEDIGAAARLQLYADFQEENRARKERGEIPLPADELRERFHQRFTPG